MRYLATIAGLLLLFSCRSTQDFNYRQGQRQVSNYNYSLGIESFLKSWELYQDEASARALAETYLKVRDFEQAEAWYSRLRRDGALIEQDYLGLAQALVFTSQYSDASTLLSRRLALDSVSPVSESYRLLLASSELGKELVNTPSSADVKPLNGINTSYSDFGATFDPAGQLIFVNDGLISEKADINTENAAKSDRYGWTGNGFLKVYEVDWDTAAWNISGERRLVERFESRLHVGPVHLTTHLSFLTVTKDQKYKPEKLSIQGKDYTIHPEIYYLSDTGKVSLEDALPLPFNAPFEYAVSDPFYDVKLSRLYFSSDMPGGYGGADLYYTFYMGEGKWTEPINLGEGINSTGDERTPFIANDGTLYFSSNGMGGLGGLDVFKAGKKGGGFEKPKNLGNPINSNRDDFSFSIHPKQENIGVFSSDRSGGRGGDDIYVVKLEFKGTLTLKGKVIDKLSGKPVPDAVVRIERNGGSQGTFISESDGSYAFELAEGGYVDLGSSKTGYFEERVKNLQLPEAIGREDSMVYQDITMEEIEVGGIYSLENIYYGYNEWEINDEAKPGLMELVDLMKRNPTLKVELHSHTDSRGSASYNLKLSEKRANAAVKFIVAQGIAQSRIVALGFGEEQPINDCKDGTDCFEPEYEVNRRTEFKIIEY